MPYDIIVLDGQITIDPKTHKKRIILFEAGLASNSELSHADERNEGYGDNQKHTLLEFITQQLKKHFPDQTIFHNNDGVKLEGLSHQTKHAIFDQFTFQRYNPDDIYWHTDPLLLSQIIQAHADSARAPQILSGEGITAASTMSKALFCYTMQSVAPQALPETLFVHPKKLESPQTLASKVLTHFKSDFLIFKPSISSNSDDILVIKRCADEIKIALDYYQQKALRTDKQGLIIQAYVDEYTVKNECVLRGKIRWILAVDDKEATLLGGFCNESFSTLDSFGSLSKTYENLGPIQARTLAMISQPTGGETRGLTNAELDEARAMVEPIAFQWLEKTRSLSLPECLEAACASANTLVTSDICQHLLSFNYPINKQTVFLQLAQNEATREDILIYLKANIFDFRVFIHQIFFDESLLSLIEDLSQLNDGWQDTIKVCATALIDAIKCQGAYDDMLEHSTLSPRLIRLVKLLEGNDPSPICKAVG